MRKELISSKLFTQLARFYPSTVTIRTFVTDDRDDFHLDSYGQPDAMWGNFASHVDINCTVAANGEPEVKRPDITIATSTFIIALAGYYPTIEPKMRAVVGSVTYDILLVEVDSHSEMTRLTVEIVI